MTEPKDESTSSLGKVADEIVVGASWMVLMRFAVRGLGIVSTLILARLLLPEDFGLVAMATLLIGLLEVLTKMNLDAYLIYNQESGRRHYDSAWTMGIIRGALAALVVVLLAKPATLFFGDPRVEEIFYWLALGSVLGGFTNIGIVDFRKKMQFDKDFAYFVLVKIISFVVTIIAAFMLRNYWALVLGMLSSSVAKVSLSFIMSPYRPRFGLSRWRKIFNFSKWLLVTDAVNYGASRADTLILGRLAGAASLGIYTMAYELATLAVTEIVTPIRRVIFPGYAKLGDDPEAFRRAFVEGLALILAITVPIAIGIGLTAHVSIPVLLGPNWLEAIPILQVLTIFSLLQLSYANTYIVIITRGHPRIVAGMVTVQLILAVPFIIIGTLNWGPVGAAVGVTLARVPTAIMAVYFAARISNASFADLAGATWRTGAAALSMVAAVLAVDALIGPETTIAALSVKFAALATTGALVYVCAHCGLWSLAGRPDGAETNLINLLGTRFRRLRGLRKGGLAAS